MTTDQSAAPLREAIATAIRKADDAFGYSFDMVSLINGVATHRLTMDGFDPVDFEDLEDGLDPVDFEDRDDGYALIEERRNLLRADAILAALASHTGDMDGYRRGVEDAAAVAADATEGARALYDMSRTAGDRDGCLAHSEAMLTAQSIAYDIRALPQANAGSLVHG